VIDGHKAAVAVCTEQFRSLGETLATSAGRSTLPLITLPFPLDTRPEAEVRELAHTFLPELLRLLGMES
jgi:hypothetical protein